MWRLLCLLAISSGCSDDCGTKGAPEFGIVASSDQVKLTYGHLVASANNDCPAPDAPSGVISLTISGIEMTSNGLITICVQRPDLLAHQTQALGSEVQLIDVSGSDTTCSYALDATRPATGTLSGQHMCSNGTDKAGFELDANAALSLKRTCAGTVDSQAVTLRGAAAVSGM